MKMTKDKRFEILGILIITVSLLVLLSFFGHDPNEDPGISPNPGSPGNRQTRVGIGSPG